MKNPNKKYIQDYKLKSSWIKREEIFKDKIIFNIIDLYE